VHGQSCRNGTCCNGTLTLVLDDAIVVTAGRKVADPVDHRQWPVELRQRLGDAGSVALADVLDERDHVLTSMVTDRFERRLTEECGKLRAEVRAEIATLHAELRADFRIGLADVRADFIKWSFLFWIGQAVTVVGTVAGLLVAFR
jgi:hypothetical protein